MSEVNTWIKIDEQLPPIGKKVLLYWRPINFKERPFHREIVIGELSRWDDSGWHCDPPLNVWSNNKYYDVNTFITHWALLPDAPDTVLIK